MTPLVRRLVLLVIAVALVGAVAVGSRPSTVASQSVGKLIVISLSHQSLTAYNGRYVVWRSEVTTGNPALPTPVGRFEIFAKFHPFEFISPWPRWSRYWYPPSWTSYAMEFARGGYFIHDAPWRSVFGPGSNRMGVPGTNYGGTHGCVNVPYVTARFLYAWAPFGTPVDVIR